MTKVSRSTEVKTLVDAINKEVVDMAKINSLREYVKSLKLKGNAKESAEISLSTLPQAMLPHEARVKMNDIEFTLWRFEVLAKACPSARLKKEMIEIKELFFSLANFSQRTKFDKVLASF